MSVALEYHEATKHSLDSIRRDRHFLDWPNQPRPYKRYLGDLERVALPREIVRSSIPALDAIARTVAADHTAIPDAALLFTLLQLSAGITKWLRSPGRTMPFRAAACTGALYHIDLYVVCADMPSIKAGVYHFDVEKVALTLLRPGDHRGVLVEATAAEQACTHAPVSLVATSTFWRNSWKYQARTYRHCFWDSGTILANLLATAAAHELPARVVMGFVDDVVNNLLGLDVSREVALAIVPLGFTSEAAPPAPEFELLDLDIQPYSPREIDYPVIRQIHQASSLNDPAGVASWRDGAARLDAAGAGSGDSFAGLIPLAVNTSTEVSRAGERTSLQPPAGLDEASAEATGQPSIETVIRKRGSARKFDQSAVSFDALSAMLAAASFEIRADFLGPAGTLNGMYLIVNAVDGLASGSYFFDRERRALLTLRTGDFREVAGFLDLGQELAADAALNVYFLADIEAIVGAMGDRGYRAAQLDASIAAGRLYLAAYAVGLAATGLTFFDDDVTGFFSPHAEGKGVMFLMAIGKRARPA